MRIDLALMHGWPGAQWSLDGEEYDGLTWLDATPKPTLPEIQAAWEDRQANPPVPQLVTARQARLALLDAGLLDQVEAAIAAGSRADQITWEFAVDVRRDHALIANLGAALNLTSERIDGLFRTAATL